MPTCPARARSSPPRWRSRTSTPPPRASTSRSSRRTTRTSPTSPRTSPGSGTTRTASTSIVDVPTSSAALAVSDITKEKNKVFINSGAGSTDLTGKACTPNTIHWTYDTYALAHGTGSALVARGARHLVLHHRRLRLRARARGEHHRRGRGRRRPGARHGPPPVPRAGLLLLPAAGAGFRRQGDRHGQRRRRHGQHHQAGQRVRHRAGRPDPRRAADLHHRRQRARPRDRAGAGADRELLLGPQRRHPRLVRAVRRKRTAAPSRRWCRPASIPACCTT